MLLRHANSQSPILDTCLMDNHGRPINYLRLSITDRCNLRCRYCRPEEGVPFIGHEEILSFEELERLTMIFCALGVEKLRVTGGEPFARKGCLPFLQRLRKIKGLNSLHVTTNGVEIRCLNLVLTPSISALIHLTTYDSGVSPDAIILQMSCRHSRILLSAGYHSR